ALNRALAARRLAHSQRSISLYVSRPSAHVGWTGLFWQAGARRTGSRLLFFRLLAQAGADIFDLGGVGDHGLLGGLEHVVAVVRGGLAQGAAFGLGLGHDL